MLKHTTLAGLQRLEGPREESRRPGSDRDRRHGGALPAHRIEQQAIRRDAEEGRAIEVEGLADPRQGAPDAPSPRPRGGRLMNCADMSAISRFELALAGDGVPVGLLLLALRASTSPDRRQHEAAVVGAQLC